MKVFAGAGSENHAIVYLARTYTGEIVEFVESVQPPIPREKKWVIIVSSLHGCPVGCPICDAGGFYRGKLSKEEILSQIDFVIDRRYPNREIPVEKFKIQFARVGEPAFNRAVLEVLEILPTRYLAPGLMPTISTVAPSCSQGFFERMLEIKNRLYNRGNFQLQFSIHTTCEAERDRLIPIKKWGFSEIADYASRFHGIADRKVTLNFALARGSELDPAVLRRFFDPDLFLIKITPINPTYSAVSNALTTFVDPKDETASQKTITEIREAGYEVILSIGNLEENFIGSNCGQFIAKYLSEQKALEGGYTYNINEIPKPAGETLQY